MYHQINWNTKYCDCFQNGYHSRLELLQVPGRPERRGADWVGTLEWPWGDMGRDPDDSQQCHLCRRTGWPTRTRLQRTGGSQVWQRTGTSQSTSDQRHTPGQKYITGQNHRPKAPAGQTGQSPTKQAAQAPDIAQPPPMSDSEAKPPKPIDDVKPPKPRRVHDDLWGPRYASSPRHD